MYVHNKITTRGCQKSGQQYKTMQNMVPEKYFHGTKHPASPQKEYHLNVFTA